MTKASKRSKRKDRLFTRVGNDGVQRFYADFRDLGGGRKALIPPGEHRATIDRDVAETLAAAQITELVSAKKQRQRVAAGVEHARGPSLKAFAAHHLEQKADAGKVTPNWLERSEERLTRAVEYFGADRALESIDITHIQAYLMWLQERPGRRGSTTLSGGTLRHHLNALSNLYRRAMAEGAVAPGYNPPAMLLEKPSAKREEAQWLEVHEAALLLEAARTYIPQDQSRAIPFIHAMLGVFLLSGGRKTEVLGLQVPDISFDRNTLTFRPNEHRRLKTENAFRVVPLWPQLAEILRAHLKQYQLAGGLAFPSPQSGGLVVELRRQLDAVAERAGWKAGEIRTKMFRHTYCAARLQTLDHGAPVSPYTVGREMGHGGTTLVERVYSHLGTMRHRSEVVEYRPEVIGKIGDTAQRRTFIARMEALHKPQIRRGA